MPGFGNRGGGNVSYGTKRFQLVKPTIQTAISYDFGWWKQNGSKLADLPC